MRTIKAAYIRWRSSLLTTLRRSKIFETFTREGRNSFRVCAVPSSWCHDSRQVVFDYFMVFCARFRHLSVDGECAGLVETQCAAGPILAMHLFPPGSLFLGGLIFGSSVRLWSDFQHHHSFSNGLFVMRVDFRHTSPCLKSEFALVSHGGAVWLIPVSGTASSERKMVVSNLHAKPFLVTSCGEGTVEKQPRLRAPSVRAPDGETSKT